MMTCADQLIGALLLNPRTKLRRQGDAGFIILRYIMYSIEEHDSQLSTT